MFRDRFIQVPIPLEKPNRLAVALALGSAMAAAMGAVGTWASVYVFLGVVSINGTAFGAGRICLGLALLALLTFGLTGATDLSNLLAFGTVEYALDGGMRGSSSILHIGGEPSFGAATAAEELTGTPAVGTPVDATSLPAGATTGAGAADTAGALTAEQLTALLPDANIAPEGLDTPTDTERDLADVVEALGGSRAAGTNLETWGWTGNVERSFNASDPAVIAAEATGFLSVSAHGFATPEAAAEALPFFSDILVDGLGYQEVEAPDLGDLARLLQVSNEDGSTNVALYVQDGTVLYRVGASSVAGDPTPDAVRVMTEVLEANAAKTINGSDGTNYLVDRTSH